MAALEKIRTRAGVFISVIIGIALLSFLVNPQDIVRYFQSSKNSIGEIGGKKIDYQSFQKEIDHYGNVMYGGQSTLSEEQSNMVRNQAWNMQLREYLFDDEFSKVGVGVSEKELGDLATGSNLSPIIKSFPDFYNPQTNQVYWENIQMFWQNPDNNPQRQQQITFLEGEIKYDALQTKYVSLISKASYINSLEVKRAVENSANSAEFSYVVERFMGGAEADSLYRVKESEAKDYYNKYKKRFEQQESRDIEMVVIPISPTQEDKDFTKSNLEKLIPAFATSDNLPQYVEFNSDNRMFDYAYHKEGSLPTNLDEFAFAATTSKHDVLGPYMDDNAFKIARIDDIRMIPDSVFFKNIIIEIRSQEDLSLADSVTNLLKNGANWSEIASMYSADPQAQLNGGEQGWKAYNQLPYPASDSIFLNPTGKIMSIPIQGGLYIFQAAQKSKESKMVRMAVVQKDVNPSKKTDEIAYGKASQLASLSQDGYEAFRKAAEGSEFPAQLATNIMPGSKQVLSLQNAQALVKWLYEPDTKKHSLSPVTNINQQFYVVAMVTEIRETGTAPFEQVKNSIGEELKREKQAEAYAAKMKEAVASSSNIEEVATKLNQNVLQVNSPVTFGTPYSYSSYIPGLGLEPKLAAAATTISELNKVSDPIIGNAGVYVISLTDKRTDEGFSESMAKQSLEQGFMMKQNEWYNVLLKAGNVKDLRAKFF